MGLRHEVMELLRHDHREELEGLVRAEPRAMRHLVARLFDADPGVRRAAARAVGDGAAAHPTLGGEVIRRLLWGLNDESATNGVYGIPALGEIGRRSPELLAPYVPHLVAAADDDGLRLAIVEALTAIATTAPEAVKPHLSALARLVDESRPEEQEALRALHALLRGGARR
jgi:hypothetical protein